MDTNKTILETSDAVELHNIAIDYACSGDYNNSIKYLLKAIELGNPDSCIEMCLNIVYKSKKYDYSDEALAAIHPSKFLYYIDLGIGMGSLDCKFYKAREQFIGDGFVEYNLAEAYKSFLELKEAEYDTEEYFDDDWSIEDYIENIKRDLRYQ